jgi:hypothetical protein
MTISSKLTTFALASALAATSLAPVAGFAQETGSVSPSSSSVLDTNESVTEETSQPEGLPDSAAASQINIKRIDSLEEGEASQFQNISQDQLAAAQEELQANPGLMSELQAKGVQLNNVVDIEAFPNGGVLVYVR